MSRFSDIDTTRLTSRRIPNHGHGYGREQYGVTGTASLTPDQRRSIIRQLLARYGGEHGPLGELASIERGRT